MEIIDHNNKNSPDKQDSNKRILGHPVLQKPNYTDHRLLNMDGIELAKIPEKRFHWYIKKGLAKQVAESTILLNFKAKGNGNIGDAFYMSEMKNECVCCGDTVHYTRHHVVPYEYRRYFPLELKASNSHDIVLLCPACHERYETEAFRFKTKISKIYQVDINGYGKERDLELVKAKSAINALMKYREKLPYTRMIQLNNQIRDFAKSRGLTDNTVSSDGSSVSETLMKQILAMDEWIGLDQYITHGEGVVNKLLEGTVNEVEQIRRIDEFCISWRKHFIDVMQPQFLNPNWSVTRSMKKQPL
jgi:hypothetical protein